MNWVDYAIIAILALGIISGLRKGLIKSISSIICLAASIIIAKNYYRKVAAFLAANTSIEEKIRDFLSENAFVKNLLLAPVDESPVFSMGGNFISDVNSFVTILILNAISVLVLFLVARILLEIAEGFLTGVFNIPGLREVNSMGGAVVGLIKNLIIIMLVFSVITPLSAIKPLSGLAEGIEESTFAKYFYNYNFILGWIWKSALEFLNK